MHVNHGGVTLKVMAHGAVNIIVNVLKKCFLVQLKLNFKDFLVKFYFIDYF